MKLPVVFLLVFPLLSVHSIDLPPMVKEAVQLELDGRIGEALDRYRTALSTEPALVQDEAVASPLSVRVLSKAAHLSIDLGYGEEAWDLGGRLLAAKNRTAVEAGTLVRMRLLRLQSRVAEAQSLFDAFSKEGTPSEPGTALLAELWRVRNAGSKSTGSVETLLTKVGGPASWVLKGDWARLEGPTEAFGIRVQEIVRIQLGVFKDWGNALTLLDMLREKGWSPFTDVKLNAAGETLHVVYIVSRQPASDKVRLEAQGLLP